MRRDNKNVSKDVSLTTMMVGEKRASLKWVDSVRSDMKEHQLDPKLAQNTEAQRKAVMAIDPGKG